MKGKKVNFKVFQILMMLQVDIMKNLIRSIKR